MGEIHTIILTVEVQIKMKLLNLALFVGVCQAIPQPWTGTAEELKEKLLNSPDVVRTDFTDLFLSFLDNQCHWQDTHKGQASICTNSKGTNNVVRGICSSGKNADCPGKKYFSIYCCKADHYMYPELKCKDGSTEFKNSKYGQYNSASGNKLMVGGCGSAGGKDCNNIGRGSNWTEGYFCEHTGFVVNHSKCQTLYGGYGVQVKCPSHHAVVSYCGSGKNGDCNHRYTSIKCCELQPRMPPR